MFRRFTIPARKAIFYARYEAGMHGSFSGNNLHWVETEHLLLGLIDVDEHETDKTFDHFVSTGNTTEMLRARIVSSFERQDPLPKETEQMDLPLSHECKVILAYVANNTVGNIYLKHLLLGILQNSQSNTTRILGEFGITREAVETHLSQR